MLGTVVNAVAVLVGGTLGLLLSKGIADRYRETATFALGLAVVYIGLDSAAQTRNPVIMIASLVIGGLLGEWLRLDERLHRFAAGLEKLFGASAGRFSEAFVTSTLVYCVGAMGIMGAIQSGVTGDHATLYAKSMLDGISSVFFASALGAGVLLSALPVFLYQGSITLGASWAAAWLTPPMQAEMNAVGGILILAIGLGILDIKRVRVANLLPAIFLAVIFAAFV